MPAAVNVTIPLAERRGRERFVCEQQPYSILARGIEADVLPVYHKYGIGVIPWSPLADGWLSGRFGAGQEYTSRRAERLPARYELSEPANRRKLEAVEHLSEVARDAGLSMVELAVAFVLSHPAVTAPTIGPRTVEQLESQLGGVDIQPSPDTLDRIGAIVPPRTTINPADAGYLSPTLTDDRRRWRT